MRKSKLTKEAINFLVSAYDDKTNSYRFIDIMDMVKSKFGIDVSAEAIRKAYHKHKQDSTLSTEEVLKTKKEGDLKSEAGQKSYEEAKPITSMSELRALKGNLTIGTGKKEYKSIAEELDEDALASLFSSQKIDEQP